MATTTTTTIFSYGSTDMPTITSSTTVTSPTVAPVGVLPGTGRILCGVAVLRGELYVARNFSSVIDVYDVRTRDFRLAPKGVDVAGLRDPVDIAASPIERIVYVSGSNDMSIFKIDGRSKTAVGRWRLGSRPFGVSVCWRKGTVFVTFRDETIVKEFSSDGEELRGIKLDARVFSNPWHAVSFRAVEAEGGNGIGGPEAAERVLVCHGWSKDSLNCVSLIATSDGSVLARYGGARGHEDDSVDLPSHVVFDSRTRHALVVDLNNSRVLRLSLPGLCSTREGAPILLSAADGLKWPRSSAIDEDRLFVGLHEGSVLIFDYHPTGS